MMGRTDVLRPARRKLAAALVFVAFLTGVHGCEDVSVTTVEVASVSVSPSQNTLMPGETAQLSATPRGPSGNAIQGRSVSWSSDDPTVATVSGSGLVEARQPGQTRITATSEGVQGTAEVSVLRRPEIVLGQERVQLEGVARETTIHEVPVEIQNGGDGTLSGLSVQVSYASGEPADWLSAELSGSQAPTTLRIRATAAELSGGVHRAEVEVSASVAGNSPRTLEVEFDVAEAPPSLELSTTAVGFVWEEGQPFPPTQSVDISNGGGGQLTGLEIEVSYPEGEPGGWLAADLDGSEAPASVALDVDPSPLQRGTYDAFVDVSSPVADNSPERVRVRLTVGDPPPELELTPDGVQWVITEQDPLPPTRTVAVENRGSGRLGSLEASITYDEGGAEGWLDANLSSLSAPANLDLSLNTTELLPDVYSASVAITSRDAINSPQTVSVGLEVLPRVAAERSEVQADPDTLVADGESTALVTVILRDSRGARIPFGGADVSIATTEGTLSEVTDHGDGTYSATLTSPTTAGTAVLTAQVDGEALPEEAEVTFVGEVVSAETSSVTADPDTVPANGTDASTVTVELRDAGDHPIGGLTDVDFDISLTGSASADSVSETTTDGTYTFDVTNTVAETVTVTVTADGVTLDDEPDIEFVEPDASNIAIVSGDNQADTVGATLPDPLVVRVTDDFGNPVPGILVTWEPDDDGSPDPSSSLTGVDGQASTTWTLGTTAGAQTLIASAVGLDSVTFDANAEAGDPAQLAFDQQPTDTETGEVIDPPVTVRVEDQFGNLVTSASDDVTLALGTDPSGGSASLSDDTTRAAVDGIATFDDLSIDEAGDGYTLAASAAGLSGTESASFNVTSGEPSTLIVESGNDQRGSVGSTLGEDLVVRVLDEFDNPVAGVDVTWTPSGDGSADPPTSTTAPNGRASTSWTLGTDAGTQTMEASTPSATPVTFEATAEAGDAAQLTLEQQPTNTEAGAVIDPAVTVRVEDQFGNLVTSASDDVTLALGTDPSGGSATLSGDTTRAAVNGVATFDDLSIDEADDGYTLAASATELSSTESASFNVTAGEPSTLIVESGNDQTGSVGSTLSEDLVARVLDEFDNPVAGVDVAWTPSGDGSADPPTSTTAPNGRASTSWTLGTDAGAQTMEASTTGATPASFDATAEAGDAAQLTFEQQPTNTEAGATISPAVTVRVEDQFGNLVTSASDDVTLALGTDPSGGSATLSGDTTRAAVNGVATFDDLSIDTADDGYTLAASATGLTDAESDPFTITATQQATRRLLPEDEQTTGPDAAAPRPAIDQSRVQRVIMGTMAASPLFPAPAGGLHRPRHAARPHGEHLRVSAEPRFVPQTR